MCLITIEPAGAILSRTNRLFSLDRNGDGFGYMYADKGRIHAFKSKSLSDSAIVKLSKQNKALQFITHHRMITRGNGSVDMCHPFRVLNHKEHGIDIFMMHNGTFGDVDADGTESDSVAINNHIIKPLLAANPNYLYSKEFHKMMTHLCDNSNRLCFLDGFGTVVTMGAWHTVDDCRVSNLYSLPIGASFNSDYPYSTYQNKGTKGSTRKGSLKPFIPKDTNGTSKGTNGIKGQGTLLIPKSQAPNTLTVNDLDWMVFKFGAPSPQVRKKARETYIPRFVETEWLKMGQTEIIGWLNESSANICIAYAYMLNFAFNMNVEETVHAGRINRYELGAMIRGELAIVYGSKCGEISEEEIDALYGAVPEHDAYKD